MPGGADAVVSGNELKMKVAQLGEDLELKVETEVSVGRRVWGARRKIDVVFTHPQTRLSLGLECKYQKVGGSVEEKIAATFEDIRAWPIRGIVVYTGEGFSSNMESYLLSTGMAVEFQDLQKWVELFFGL